MSKLHAQESDLPASLSVLQVPAAVSSSPTINRRYRFYGGVHSAVLIPGPGVPHIDANVITS